MFKRFTNQSQIICIVCLLMLVMGCGVKEKDLVGTWKPDIEAMENKMSRDLKKDAPPGVSKGQIEEFLEDWKRYMQSITLVFKADGSYESSDLFSREKGTWTLEGNRLITVADGAKKPESQEIRLRRDKMVINMDVEGETMEIIFRKIH